MPLADLQVMLEDAVRQEDYQAAARLRDELTCVLHSHEISSCVFSIGCGQVGSLLTDTCFLGLGRRCVNIEPLKKHTTLFIKGWGVLMRLWASARQAQAVGQQING